MIFDYFGRNLEDSELAGSADFVLEFEKDFEYYRDFVMCPDLEGKDCSKVAEGKYYLPVRKEAGLFEKTDSWNSRVGKERDLDFVEILGLLLVETVSFDPIEKEYG